MSISCFARSMSASTSSGVIAARHVASSSSAAVMSSMSRSAQSVFLQSGSTAHMVSADCLAPLRLRLQLQLAPGHVQVPAPWTILPQQTEQLKGRLCIKRVPGQRLLCYGRLNVAWMPVVVQGPQCLVLQEESLGWHNFHADLAQIRQLEASHAAGCLRSSHFCCQSCPENSRRGIPATSCSWGWSASCIRDDTCCPQSCHLRRCPLPAQAAAC